MAWLLLSIKRTRNEYTVVGRREEVIGDFSFKIGNTALSAGFEASLRIGEESNPWQVHKSL